LWGLSFVGNRRWTLLLILGLAVKLILMVIAPWGFDFTHTFKMVNYSLRGVGFNSAPWVWVTVPFYRLWMMLPLDHSGVAETLLKGEVKPLGLEGSLLVFLLKLPLLTFDLACGVVLSLYARKLGSMDWLRTLALWVLNPYVTLVVEMGGSMDALPVTLMALTVFLYMSSRVRHSVGGFASLLVGVAVKLYPVLTSPILLIFQGGWRRRGPVLVASTLGAGLYFYWVWRMGVDPLYSLLNYSPVTFHVSEFMLTPYDSRIGLATMAAFLYGVLVYRYWGRGESEALPALMGFLLAYFAFLNWWPSYLLVLVAFMTLHTHVSSEGKRVYLTLILLAFFFELSAFGFGYPNSLFFIPLYSSWMKTASVMLQTWASHVVVKLVVEPLLRSAFTAVSLYQAGKLLIQGSPTLLSLLRRLEREPTS